MMPLSKAGHMGKSTQCENLHVIFNSMEIWTVGFFYKSLSQKGSVEKKGDICNIFHKKDKF